MSGELYIGYELIRVLSLRLISSSKRVIVNQYFKDSIVIDKEKNQAKGYCITHVL